MLKSIGAYAVRSDDPDNPLLADSIDTLNRVIALKWIGNWTPGSSVDVSDLRDALLAERWADAFTRWMELAGIWLNIYPSGIEIHEERDYPDSEFGFRLQTSRLFSQH